MRKFLSLCLLGLFAMVGSAQAIDDGTYYLYNVSSGQWLNFGGSDGYAPAFFRFGAPLKIKASGSGYKIQGPFYDSPFLTSGMSKDGTGSVFTITPTAGGYTIATSAGKRLGWDGSSLTSGKASSHTVALLDGDERAVWQFFTREQLIARLADASEETPIDATFFIDSPEMHRHNSGTFDYSSSKPYANRTWIGMTDDNYGHAGGSNCNYSGFTFSNALDTYQDLEGLPAGRYEVKVQGFYRYGSNGTATKYTASTMPLYAELYAGEQSTKLMPILKVQTTTSTDLWSSTDWTRSFGGGYIPYPKGATGTSFPTDMNNAACQAMDMGYYADNKVNVTVGSDGKLRIGLRVTQNTDSWTVFDNFQLTYYGLDLTDMKADALTRIEGFEAKNTTSETTFAAAIAEAKSALDAARTLDAIEAAVAQASDAYDAYVIRLDEAANAELYQKAEEEQSTMVPTTAAVDYTRFLKNADLKQGLESWTARTGKTSTNVATSWAAVTKWNADAPCIVEAYSGWGANDMGTYSMTQDVVLTPGKYRLTAKGFYRWGSAYDSDIKNATSKKRSFAYLKAGLDSVAVMRLADIDQLDVAFNNGYANTVGAAAAEFKKGNYDNTLVFDIARTQKVTIGFAGTHDRDKCWFIGGPFTLEKVTDAILAAEAQQRVDDARTSFAALKAQYANIARQADAQADDLPADLTPYDGSIADADAAAATSVAQVEAAKDKLADELGRFMKESLAAYDLTALITNPDFETGNYNGWDVAYDPYNTEYAYDMGARETANATYANPGSHGQYLFNSWWRGNTQSTPQFVMQTLSRLPVGSYKLSAGIASDQDHSKWLLAWAYEADHTTLSKNEVIDHRFDNSMLPATDLYFDMAATGKVRIGVYTDYWFKADNFRLEVEGIAAARKVSEELWGRMTDVMAQATDHSAYDAALAAATSALATAKNGAEIDALTADVRQAFNATLQTYATNTANGRFDLTPLIAEASFDASAKGWTLGGTSNTIIYDAATHTCEKIGTTDDMTMTQTLEALPAGPYTFEVQAFYRTRSLVVDADDYDKGRYEGKGKLLFGDAQTTIRSINSDARYTPADASDLGAAGNLSVPDRLSGFKAACEQGRYWNTVSTTLPSETDVTMGIALESGAASTSAWMPFDNFRLYYGQTPAVTLDEAQPMAIDHVVPATTVTLRKTLAAGEWTPLCVPFSVSDATAQGIHVGRVLSVIDGTISLQPVDAIEAGRPYMVKSDGGASELVFSNVTIDPSKPDLAPTPWYDAMTQGTYDGYTFTADGHSVESATVNVVDMKAVDFTYNVENANAHRFLSEVYYEDASATRIAEFNKAPVGRRDQPNVAYVPVVKAAADRTLTLTRDDKSFAINVPAGADHVELGALIPGQTYTYAMSDASSAGTIRPTGQLRMIKAVGISNIRDMGGWVNDKGQMVRYGKVYRGGELNGSNNHEAPIESVRLLRQLGVEADLDFRSWSIDNVECHTASPFNTEGYADVQYRASNQWESGTAALTTDTTIVKWAANLNFVIDNVLADRPVYFHCVWGADRTGIMGLLVDGLMGLSEDQIYKDYELTSFSWAGVREKSGMVNKVAHIKTMAGATLQDKFVTYCTQVLGIDAQRIADFQAAMLGEAPNSALMPEYAAFRERCQTMAGGHLDTEASDLLAQSDVAAAIAQLQTVLSAYAESQGGLDVTAVIQNPAFAAGNTTGWTALSGGSVAVNDKAECQPRTAEVYQKDETFSQKLIHMPAGRYTLKVQGFQRMGSPEDAYAAYKAGSEGITARLFAGDESVALRSIYADAQPAWVHTADDRQNDTGVYTPFSMNAASDFMGKAGAYWNLLDFEQADANSTMTIGVRSGTSGSMTWTIWSNFRLYYEPASETLTLDESATSIDLPAEATRYASVTTNRQLKAGKWNTFCMPIDVKASDFERVIVPYQLDGTTVTFAQVDPSETLRAGRPYIVKVAEDVTPAYASAIVRVGEGKTVPTATDGFTFTGTLTRSVLNGQYYISGDKFYFADVDVTMKGQRAYITLPAEASIKAFMIDDLVDALGGVDADLTDEPIYNVAGQRLVRRPSQGIYIQGGRKYIAK